MSKFWLTGKQLASVGQALIPLALLGLVGLVAGLVVHARSLETSHRATAENALRDYAALAAWQYTQRAEALVTEHAHITLHNVHAVMRQLHLAGALPGPDAILTIGDTVACGIGADARFAFRIDLPSRRSVFSGTAPSAAAQEAIAARLAALSANASRKHMTMRMFVDTLGGAPRAIAWGVVRGADSTPVAIYGVEADPSALESHLTRLFAERPLLPPSLVRNQRLDSLMTLEVRSAGGHTLATIGTVARGSLSAKDTAGEPAGSFVTSVVIRPQAAATLLIGGLPASRQQMLLVLLAASVLLASLALLQLRRARELSRLRTRFVANVSHELRTPLAQISMFSETLLLERERSADEAREFLSIIFREARRLSTLVESVLSFSRSESASRPRALRLQPMDVGLEVRDAVRAFTPLAAAAGVRLELRTGDADVALVERDALRQVLLNLLDNAVKFGPASQTVAVSVTRAEEGKEIVIAVDDQGPGIPATQRRKVFEPFVQVLTAKSRATGAGIGLAVVAELVAAHSGRVWISDAPTGRGARVSVALPAAKASQAATAPEPARETVLVHA